MSGFAHSACPICDGACDIVAVDGHQRRIARCRDCAHGFVQNPPAPGRLRAEFQGQAYFEQNYGCQGIASLEDDSQWEAWLRLRFERLDRFLPEAALFSGPPRRIFEVGCLEGRVLAALAARGHRVAGCDLNATIVARGRRAFGIDIRTGTVGECGFPRRAYDVVLGYHLLHYALCPQASLASWTQLLAPGGHLFLVFPLGGAEGEDPLRQQYFSRESLGILAQTHCRAHRLAVIDNNTPERPGATLGFLVGSV
jgi:SAM-dependent methyltransferase